MDPMTKTMKRALLVMATPGSFTFLSDSAVGKGPRANKRAFVALERLGLATMEPACCGPIWRITEAGREEARQLTREG